VKDKPTDFDSQKICRTIREWAGVGLGLVGTVLAMLASWLESFNVILENVEIVWHITVKEYLSFFVHHTDVHRTGMKVDATVIL